MGEHLLLLKVSTHAADLSVPEVNFVALDAFTLFIKAEVVLQLLNFVVAIVEGVLQLLDLVSEGSLISVVLSSLDFSTLSLHLNLLILPLELSKFFLEFFLLLSILLSSKTIQLFGSEFSFLEILKRSSQLTQVFPKSLILKVSLVKLLTVLVEVVGHRFITFVDIQFCAHAVVLLVEEVNLISQLLGDLLIGVLLVLHVKLL